MSRLRISANWFSNSVDASPLDRENTASDSPWILVSSVRASIFLQRFQKYINAKRKTSNMLGTVRILFSCFLATAVATDAHSNSSKSDTHPNALPYERTFMKYHHRRKIHALYAPDYDDFLNDDFERFKRTVLQEHEPTESVMNEDVVKKRSMKENSKNKVENVGSKESKKPENPPGKWKDVGNVKKTIIPSYVSVTTGHKQICLHKYHQVAQSEKISSVVGTPSPAEAKDEELLASDKVDDPSRPYNLTLPDGSTVLVEDCAHSCYTLWLPNRDGSTTVLGQGCWTISPQDSAERCDRNQCAGGPAQLPGAYFCCCTGDLCNTAVIALEFSTVSSVSGVATEAPLGTAAGVAAYTMLAGAAMLSLVLFTAALYRSRRNKPALDIEKDGAGSNGDSLATGHLCVDNLNLVEHIGAGKFGSVWRGSIGGTPVAVKLYSSGVHWQREADIYSQLAHPNLLRYYGSDTRPTLTESGGQQHLIVLELCASTLRRQLQAAPISWRQFAELAHGLASALAYLHNEKGVVHRDINSNNVLVSTAGAARLADLGAAAKMSRHKTQSATIAEAGTVRYLAPEALEGALDLAGARAALCAVDVFALGLVLWEMLWRTQGAHAGSPPQYAQPYEHAGLARDPTLTQMQALVSRGKVRPPLPRGPVQEARALRLAADTCDECWDHDAEARLTAVCVEERMLELKHMLRPSTPLVRDNNLHPHASADDKNSNVLNERPCSLTTPLLYAHPHIGRNACLERNTNHDRDTEETLVHRSLKDDPEHDRRPRNVEERCLSVARASNHRQHGENSVASEVRSVQRPLEYVPNDVSCGDRLPKQTNILNDVRFAKPRWSLGRLFGKSSKSARPFDTEVKLESAICKTSVVQKQSNLANGRPSDLTVDSREFFENPCTLSPPNRTLSPNMNERVFGFNEAPNEESAPSQVFAVIVPKAKKDECYIEMRKTKGSSESIPKKVDSISSQSVGNSESEDSTVKRDRSSRDERIINSGNSSRASIELHYLNQDHNYGSNDDSYRSDCSSSLEDENLMLLSENGGSRITMQPIAKEGRRQNDVLKESKDFMLNKFPVNGYGKFDNEFSDPQDKENFTGDNPVYVAALNGDIEADVKPEEKSPKPSLKYLSMKRQRSLEQVSEIFSSSGDLSHLQNPAGRVKTPGDLPAAVRRARRDRLQRNKSESNRLSLYDDRMMFGNSL